MNLLIKKHILTFLIFFEITLIACFIYYFDFHINDIGFIEKSLAFDLFFFEFLIIILFIHLFFEKHFIFKFLMIMFIFIFISINLTQLISYVISSDFISQTALNNVEFIGFILTKKNILTVFLNISILIFIPIIFTYILSYSKQLSSIYTHPIFTIIIIIFLTFIIIESKYLSLPYTTSKEKVFTHNNLTYTAPITSLIKLFIPKEKIDINFTTKDIQLLNHAGFFFNPGAIYPLMKKNTYTSSREMNSTIKKPNIILLFTEGLSARTLSVYNKNFNDLTPNIQKFSENNHTMVAKDYYNHTAATYKGLHGQLCSLFPSLGGRQWNKSILNSENINYQCIAHILNLSKYDTTYLNVHLKNTSGNDEMASHLGFKNVISAETLKTKYLKDKTGYRKHELTDHQAYNALVNYLKQNHNNPFFISMYTAETHAWCNTSEDGTIYKDGNNEVLNTLHNLDNAFGKFWDYFKDSKYAKNTIIILTSDHAHYFDDAYVALMKNKKEHYYKKFIDKIPLLIYAPTHILPKTLQTNQSTSLDLAPSIMHLLGMQKYSNSFLGNTIFGRGEDFTHKGIAAYNSHLYVIDKNHIHYNKQTSPRGKKYFDLIARYFEYMRQLEIHNNIYKK